MPYAVIISAQGTTSCRAIGPDDALMPGETFAETQPEPTLADATAMLSTAVQTWLDQTAQVNGYDSLASCVSYLNSSITQYADDAKAALAWRDAVWQAAFVWQQNAAASPPTTVPTAAEVIAGLPQPDAYGWIVHTPGANG